MMAGGAIGVMFASACGVSDSPPAPDFSGIWARYAFDFEPPSSGPGPVANMKLALPDGTTDLSASYGDHTNPILKPEAAAIVKRRGETSLSGVNFPDPSNQCAPQAPPFLFAFQPAMQLLQGRDEITILYVFDSQVRRVRMNASHPVPLKPSAMGDSVGFFDGDTLVVDTVGIQLRPTTMADRFGTPQSEGFHLVERYRLIDAAQAKSAAERQQKINGRRIGSRRCQRIAASVHSRGSGVLHRALVGSDHLSARAAGMGGKRLRRESGRAFPGRIGRVAEGRDARLLNGTAERAARRSIGPGTLNQG
jgi:hypothetical protein